jgi:hypothetical protein
MRFSGKVACLVAVIFMAVFVSATKADQVDNPAYKAWSKFKKDSTATYTQNITVNGMSIDFKIVDTLKDITDDHVTIEEGTTMSMGGRGGRTDTNTRDISAKVDAKDMKEDGEEDVKAMDKTFHCKVIELKETVPGRGGQTATVNAKIWVNTDVPGGVVQMKFSSDVGGESVEQTRTLTAFEAK